MQPSQTWQQDNLLDWEGEVPFVVLVLVRPGSKVLEFKQTSKHLDLLKSKMNEAALCCLCSDLGGSVREDDRPDRPDGQPAERHHVPQCQRAPHASEPGLPQEGLGDPSQEPGQSSWF